MVVGVLQIQLGIPLARSLKEKRRVVKRAVDKTRARFNVSIAEVGDNDVHNRAQLGVTAVANDGPFVNSVLDKVLDAIESYTAGEAELLHHDLELVHF